MKVNKTVRLTRIRQMKDLYTLAMADNEHTEESLYQLVKQAIEDNIDKVEKDIIDLIYSGLENIMSLTLESARKNYRSFNEKPINLKELLYNKDGKTLEERIKFWLRREKNVMSLLYHLCLVLETETFQIIHQTIKNKVNTPYVEIIGEGGCEVCADYCDGEVYKEDEIELPPYHPGCMCEVIYYEKEDVLNDL